MPMPGIPQDRCIPQDASYATASAFVRRKCSQTIDETSGRTVTSPHLMFEGKTLGSCSNSPATDSML